MSSTIVKTNGENPQDHMRTLAQEIVSYITAADPAHSQELFGLFVSELTLSFAEEDRRKKRRQRQAEGIAAAKARGVQFGRPKPPLPDDFDKFHQAWREGRMTLRQAADACGMAKSSFHTAAIRKEQTCPY